MTRHPTTMDAIYTLAAIGLAAVTCAILAPLAIAVGVLVERARQRRAVG